MPKKISLLAVPTFLLLVCLPHTIWAQGPYNVSEYLLMPVGSWKVFDHNGDGIGDQQVFFMAAGKYIAEVHPTYWLYADIWEIDATGLYFWCDWEPGAPAWLNPPIFYANSLYIGQRARSFARWIGPPAEWYLKELTITDEGLTVDTPAGTFTGCLQIRVIGLSQHISPGSVSWSWSRKLLYCVKDVGIVKEINEYETQIITDYFLAPKE